MTVRMTRAVEIPAKARPTASPQASVEDRKGPLVSVGPNRLVTPLLSSAMVLVSIAISYPHPWHTRRSARRQSGQHGGVNPNLRAHSPQTSNPPDPVYAFVQVTGLRPQNLMTAKTGPFSIPPPGIRKRASDHVSAGQRPSHALGGR